MNPTTWTIVSGGSMAPDYLKCSDGQEFRPLHGQTIITSPRDDAQWLRDLCAWLNGVSA